MPIYHPNNDTLRWKKRRVIWLFSGCAMISVILIVGGLTRLNQAGLSITEWEVVSGVVPPLSDMQWEEAFETYRQFPEYHYVHRGMSLEEFKVIYWWEYSHRMLSRLLGILFLIPFVIFVKKRVMPPGDAMKIAGIALLGGVQAFLGWYMVQSGLEDQPVVSHLRLGIHLVFAFFLFQLLWTMAWNRMHGINRTWHHMPVEPVIRKKGNVLGSVAGYRTFRGFAKGRLLKFLWPVAVAVLYLQVMAGGWTAGLKAGYVYPTFPMMGDYWIPPELGRFAPWWYDLSHNAISVQYLHRILALLLTLLVLPLSAAGIRSGIRPLQLTGLGLLIILALQITSGAFNLLWGVPAWLSSAHQFGALLLLALLVLWRYYFKRPGSS